MQRFFFEQLVDSQVRDIHSTLTKKQKEYSRDEDVLINFRSAAVMQNATMREALGGMMAKHTVSIFQLINSWECAPMETWSEKITDHINYLILLKAIVAEELQAKTAAQPLPFEEGETPLYKSGIDTTPA